MGNKSIILFIGLPYTGKTALIRRLQQELPGRAVYADELFTRTVPPDEISLDRWLRESERLAEQIRAIVQSLDAERFYVELGIMPAGPRRSLLRWAQAEGYRLLPLWLRCDDEAELNRRHRARVRRVGVGGSRGATIEISLGGLYQRICAAFEEPTAEEGFIIVDTIAPLDECVAVVRRMIAQMQRSSR